MAFESWSTDEDDKGVRRARERKMSGTDSRSLHHTDQRDEVKGAQGAEKEQVPGGSRMESGFPEAEKKVFPEGGNKQLSKCQHHQDG